MNNEQHTNMMSGHQKRQKNIKLSLFMQLTIQNSPSYLFLVSEVIIMVALDIQLKILIQKYPRMLQQK